MARRCEIVGYRNSGRLIAEAPGCTRLLESIAVCGPETRAGAVQTSTDYHDLLASDVSGIVIATPPDLHFQIGIDPFGAP